MSISYRITKKLINYDSPSSFAFKMRQKRAAKIVALINECYDMYGEVTIIDIGGTRVYWKIIPENFLKEKKVRITIVNLPSDKISSILSEKDDELFTFCVGDGCNLVDFSDKSFHIAHSNSVIEHVGLWANKQKLSKEMQRVAKRLYLQTPYFWFPVEPHFVTPFFHWLPKKLRIYLLRHFNLGWYKKVSSYEEAEKIDFNNSLLTKKELSTLFPACKMYREKFLFLTKSLVVIQ